MKRERRSWMVIVRSLRVLAGLALVSAVVIWSPDNSRARSIREWLTAIGTVGAVIVALWVTWSDRRRRRREDAEASERFQHAEAESVIAFRETIPHSEREPTIDLPAGSFSHRLFPPFPIRLVCENWSSRPVHNTLVVAEYIGDDGALSDSRFSFASAVIGPKGQRSTLTLKLRTHRVVEDQELRVSVYFTDVRGRRWINGPGGLRQASPDEHARLAANRRDELEDGSE